MSAVMWEFASILVVALALVTVTYIVYRYYAQKVRYAYKTERLEHDNLVMADGGENDDQYDLDGDN